MWVRLVREIKCCHSQLCAVILYIGFFSKVGLQGLDLRFRSVKEKGLCCF